MKSVLVGWKFGMKKEVVEREGGDFSEKDFLFHFLIVNDSSLQDKYVPDSFRRMDRPNSYG